VIDAEFPPFWDHYFLLRDARLLVERGCTDFDVMEKITTENHSALVGDVADDIKADLVLLSTDCVHEESVNANLLAEFCPCATLLIP